ncbi:MAG: class I SAM-dependent methyltransferase [Clostridia bacterium]|nr:class I SAM-dependent methyltransferase [Clostridia bacterium]
MRCDRYQSFFTADNLMGPNSVRLLDELLEEYPLRFSPEQRVLDLGCGTGLTSMFMAKETGATVYANDLWVKEEENRARFAAWGMADRLIPVHEDATKLRFDRDMFDAMISIDSYHYFAGEEGFFAEKILPYIRPGGTVLIAVPGMKAAYDGQSEALLTPWLGDEAYMFRGPGFWRRVIGAHEEIDEARTWEMKAFDLPWQEWFATGHRFAIGDMAHYDSLIRPYTAFVGIMVRKRR